jgi:hypothetical protein
MPVYQALPKRVSGLMLCSSISHALDQVEGIHLRVIPCASALKIATARLALTYRLRYTLSHRHYTPSRVSYYTPSRTTVRVRFARSPLLSAGAADRKH